MSGVAKLPTSLIERTIGDLKVGEIVYTVPWAMAVDETDRSCWLSSYFSFSDTPAGTYEMCIELRKDGLHVWPPRGATWRVTHVPADAKWLPVVKLYPWGQNDR